VDSVTTVGIMFSAIVIAVWSDLFPGDLLPVNIKRESTTLRTLRVLRRVHKAHQRSDVILTNSTPVTIAVRDTTRAIRSKLIPLPARSDRSFETPRCTASIRGCGR
jgi:hypothetical protein